MRRGIIGGGGAGVAIALLAGALALPGGARTGAAQDGTPAATATRAAEEAEVTALRTEVAALATEVARLGGADEEAVAGRLGGSRSGFEEAYGRAMSYIGDDQAVYAVPATGRVTVTFEAGRAVRLVVSPERPADKPTDEPDAADFDLAEAAQVARDFASADAALGELDPGAGDAPAATGTSDALAGERGTPTAGACPTPGQGGTFAVFLTTTTDETVSAVTLERAPDAAPVAPTPAPPSERETSGGVTSARVGLSGGSTSINGIRVAGIQSREEGDSEDGRRLAVELEVENQTEGELLLDPSYFVLLDGRGRQIPAVCGGIEPSLVGQELAGGEAAQGWVTFLLPERFSPRQVVYFVNGSAGLQIAFILD